LGRRQKYSTRRKDIGKAKKGGLQEELRKELLLVRVTGVELGVEGRGGGIRNSGEAGG